MKTTQAATTHNLRYLNTSQIYIDIYHSFTWFGYFSISKNKIKKFQTSQKKKFREIIHSWSLIPIHFFLTNFFDAT